MADIDRSVLRGAVRMKLEGFDAVRARVRGMPTNIRGAILRGGVRAAVAVLARGVKRRMPEKTGTLKKSVAVSARQFFGGDVVRGEVFIGNRVSGGGRRGATGAERGAFYAAILEGGAAPHEIVPKTARALKVAGGYAAFGLGATFRARVKKHPGVKAMRMWERTRTEDIGMANTAFEKYVEQRIDRYWNTGK
jgi:Bacteriophage HK97-gp10, putative tail-component